VTTQIVVSLDKLLHKLDDYGVRGSINRWQEMFLTQRKIKVVIDGDESEETTVDSFYSKYVTFLRVEAHSPILGPYF
jgi:hypothetical protein